MATDAEHESGTERAGAPPVLLPPAASAVEVTTKKSREFYSRAVLSFLHGVEAGPAQEGKEAKPPVDALRISGLGEAIDWAVGAAAAAASEGVGAISWIKTAYPTMEVRIGLSDEALRAQDLEAANARALMQAVWSAHRAEHNTTTAELRAALESHRARHDSRERQRTGNQRVGRRFSWDSVWGEVEFEPAWTSRSAWRHSAAIAMFDICPCLMGTFGCFRSEIKSGLSLADRKRAWKRLICSWTFALSVVQTLILLATTAAFGYAPLAENNMLGPNLLILDALGAKNAALILERNEWWRLLTPIMLHSGWFHLVANLILQLRVGMSLEVCWGHSAFLLIYVVSGAVAYLASCVMMPNSMSVGSSGALCGVLGAWPVFMLATWNQTLPRDVGLRNTRITMVAGSIMIMIPLSFLPLVDRAAHIGGLLTGAALSAILFASRLQFRAWRIATCAAGFLALATMLAGLLGVFLTITEPADELLHVCPPVEVPFRRCLASSR